MSIFDVAFRTSGVSAGRQDIQDIHAPFAVPLGRGKESVEGKKNGKTEARCRVAGNLARVVHFLLSRRNARHSGRARDQRREHAIFFSLLLLLFFFLLSLSLFFFSPLAERPEISLKRF